MGDPTQPDPETLRKVLVLGEMVHDSDPKLAKRIREWLFKRSDDYLQAYAFETAKVLTSPPTSRWHQAEDAWGRWVMSVTPSLTEAEAETMTRAVTEYVPEGVHAFPTIERFTLGLAIADLWAREGHPEIDRNRAAFETTVCGRQNDYGKLSVYCGGRRSFWYGEALASDAGAHRLAQALLARKDTPLTTSAILGVGGSPRALTVLADLEQDASLWRDAVLAVSRMENHSWIQDWLIPELRRVWRARPAWRGVILYALAQASGEYADEQHDEHGLVPFARFARDFEGGASRSDVISFLEQAPRALDSIRWILPARTKGFAVVPLVLPHLDAYLALPKGSPTGSPPGPGFGSFVGYLCYHDHDLAGLAELRAYFSKRAPLHPGDPLNTLMAPYSPRACRGHG
jgi:hypothetical protein